MSPGTSEQPGQLAPGSDDHRDKSGFAWTVRDEPVNRELRMTGRDRPILCLLCVLWDNECRSVGTCGLRKDSSNVVPKLSRSSRVIARCSPLVDAAEDCVLCS